MKKIALGIVIGLLVVFNSNAQILTPPENAEEQAQTQQEEQLIIGVWNPEGAMSVDYTFSQNDLTIKINGQIYKTYYWAISTHTTPTDLVISDLIIENIQDSNDRRRYEITALNSNIMNLLYNEGLIFATTTYNRQ